MYIYDFGGVLSYCIMRRGGGRRESGVGRAKGVVIKGFSTNPTARKHARTHTQTHTHTHTHEHTARPLHQHHPPLLGFPPIGSRLHQLHYSSHYLGEKRQTRGGPHPKSLLMSPCFAKSGDITVPLITSPLSVSQPNGNTMVFKTRDWGFFVEAFLLIFLQ